MSAFVDTSALYAFAVSTEEEHTDVVAAIGALLDARRDLRTTSYVVVETTSLLQARFALASVREFVQRLSPVLSVEFVSEMLHRKGVERLLREDRRRLSLVDCVSFEFMRAEGLREALTLDADFAMAGFRLLPGGDAVDPA